MNVIEIVQGDFHSIRQTNPKGEAIIVTARGPKAAFQEPMIDTPKAAPPLSLEFNAEGDFFVLGCWTICLPLVMADRN